LHLRAPRASWQGPSPLAQRQDDPWPAVGQSPRPAPAGSGAGLCPSRTCRSTRHRPARAGETRVAFPSPPALTKALSPLQWQGPSPLPQRPADPWPAGGQSPRPAPAPPLAGASRPPGRALASVSPGPAGLRGTGPSGRGKRGAFPGPARTGEGTFTAPLAGAIAPAAAPHGPLTSRGPQPPASARPATGGRFSPAGPGAGLSVFPDLPVYRGPSRAGGGNALRFPVPPEQAKALPLPERIAGIRTGRGPKTHGARPAHGGRWPAVLRAAQVFADAACRGGRNAGRGPASRPQDQSLSPDRKEFPGRNADSPLSAPCSGVKPDLHTGPRTLFVIWSHRFHGRRCAASAGSQLSSRALAALEQPSPTQRLGA